MKQPNTQEHTPQEEPNIVPQKVSLWQRYRKSPRAKTWTYILMVAIPVIMLFVSMYTVMTHPRFNPYPKTAPQVPRPTDLNVITHQVLADLNAHGYDVQYKTILINWRQSDVSQVNCSPDRCDTRVHLTRTDTANDLRDLENLYWYKELHPKDTSLNSYIARMLPIVQKEWGNTTLNKGWIYYTLLRLSDYSHNADYWNKTILHWAEAQYKAIDPAIGVDHGPLPTTAGSDAVMLDDGYRVDHALESGLALVDAGTRYQHPEWIVAGRREVNTVIKQSYSQQYHLFGRIYLIKDAHYGSNTLIDPQARMGETGQELEALIRTGTYTKNADYLSLALAMLNSLQNSPLRDQQNGGFYFKMYLAPYQGKPAGYVDKSIKETRQMHTLIAIHLGNLAFHNRWAELEKDVTTNAVQHLFLPGSVPGFTYRVLPDGKLYPCPKCIEPKVEDWVTSEADNIALEAMQTILTTKWQL